MVFRNRKTYWEFSRVKEVGSWLGHVERMPDGRVAKSIYKWKPYATRMKGRPRLRWEDDVRNYLKKWE
jgi:hypothetical protein